MTPSWPHPSFAETTDSTTHHAPRTTHHAHRGNVGHPPRDVRDTPGAGRGGGARRRISAGGGNAGRLGAALHVPAGLVYDLRGQAAAGQGGPVGSTTDLPAGRGGGLRAALQRL